MPSVSNRRHLSELPALSPPTLTYEQFHATSFRLDLDRLK